MRSRSRPQRRKLFESFGIIPSLQYTAPEDLDEDEDALHNGNDEDSDEVLNIPSLMMATRVSMVSSICLCQEVNFAVVETIARTISCGQRISGDF
jgi:hypothetical protein